MGPPSEHADGPFNGAHIVGDSMQQKDAFDPPIGPLNDVVTITKDENINSEESKRSHSMLYRRSIEIRDSENKRLDYYQVDTEDDDYQDNKSTPFEYVKIYKTSRWAHEEAKKPVLNDNEAFHGKEKATRPYPPAGSTPRHLLRIFSVSIIHALRSIVTYYPSQDLNGDFLEIYWPYPVLVHHYDQLADFRDQRAGKDPATLCRREANAAEDLDSLLQFLDEHVMREVREEIERNKRGLYTFDHFWVALKPGVTRLACVAEGIKWIPSVVHSLSGGTFEYPITRWNIRQWSLSFDGGYLNPEFSTRSKPKFDGLAKCWDHILFDANDTKQSMGKYAEVMEAVKQGEQYWKLLNKQCRTYNGKMVTFPHNEVNGLVMVDLKSYHASRKLDPGPSRLMNTSDFRNWKSDCDCPICIQKGAHWSGNSKFEDSHYNCVTNIHQQTPTDHQSFLCPKEIHAFIFKTRTWELLHVENLQEPRFNRDMIDNLVMEPTLAKTLKSLTMSFARVNASGGGLTPELWAADFVEGKGSGLIFLLHGTPGVGKTFTAECIANFLGRPLMVLTTSDIGIEPREVEQNLTKHFKTAKSWDAVLLIDEADVFLAYRDVKDLQRSSLVASFLRALEYYDGILFLTTNRVGAFDDAVLSRVHIQLFYPEFTHDQRVKLWLTFMKKLNEDTKRSMRVISTAKEYVRGKEVADLKLNGRQIKNAFQTAVALAEHEALKDEDGKTLVTDDHLQAVLELNKNFMDYIKTIHEHNWAQRQWERPE